MPITPDAIQNIVILRLSSIGDITLTTPVIRALRTRFPQARIDYVVKQEFSELLQTNPHLTTLYGFEKRDGLRGLIRLGQRLRQQQYDLLVDLHNNFRTHVLRFLLHPAYTTLFTKHFVKRTLLVKTGVNLYTQISQVPDRYLQPLQRFGVADDGKGLELFPTAQHQARIQEIFQRANLVADTRVIGFGPIAAHPLKQWPPERFSALGQELVRRYNARIVIFGAPKETEQAQQIAAQIPNAPIVLCGQVSLLESAAALARCALLVANDSSLVHIAAAMQRPVVVMFGPTVEEFGFYPYRTPSIVLAKPLPCRPCTHTGKGQCRIKTHACMQMISTEEALEAVQRMVHLDLTGFNNL